MKNHSLALALLLPLTLGTLSAQSTTDPTLAVTAGYATYYNGTTPYTMPQGLTGIIVTGNEGTTLTLTDQYQSGDYVPAGTPLLLKGAEGSYTLANPFTETTTVEVKQSTGSFTPASGTYHATWTATNEPQVTISTGANNMKFDAQGNIEAYSGSAKSSVYTISAPAGYYLVNSTLTAKTAVSGMTVTLTTGDKTYAVSNDAQTINLGATNTFTLSGENKGVTLSDFTLTLAKLTTTVSVNKNTGSFAGDGTYHRTWTATNDPKITVAHSGRNNMTYDTTDGNIVAYSGNPADGSYRITAPPGYTVTGFSFAAKNKQSGQSVTVTVNDTAYTMTDEAQTITGTNSFTVTGANTGAVLSAFTVTVTKTAPTAATGNLLKGTDEAALTTATGDNNFYKLSLDDETKSKVGFYWGATDGGAFQNGAHRAYLALPKSSSARIKGFALEGSVTGIAGITTTETANKAVYTLDGRRVSNGTQLPAGLYIVGGKKVIIK